MIFYYRIIYIYELNENVLVSASVVATKISPSVITAAIIVSSIIHNYIRSIIDNDVWPIVDINIGAIINYHIRPVVDDHVWSIIYNHYIGTTVDDNNVRASSVVSSMMVVTASK